MNKLILTVGTMFFLSINAFAQFSDTDLRETDGLSVGIEKNNSGWIDYGLKNGLHVNVKHTLIADKLPRQSWRVSASYNLAPKYVLVSVAPFVTSDWYTSFVNIGSSIKVSNLWRADRFMIGAEYAPYYDSDLKFQNGWAFAAQVRIHKNISLFAEYGRKPDYRIAYERAYLGFEVKVLDLNVKPMLEIPVYDSGVRFDHSKIQVSACYTFHIKKN